jgi:hypothetical protein
MVYKAPCGCHPCAYVASATTLAEAQEAKREHQVAAHGIVRQFLFQLRRRADAADAPPK